MLETPWPKPHFLREAAPLPLAKRMPEVEKHFDEELRAFKEKLLFMGSHAEAAVTRSLEAMWSRNDSMALQVERDDDVLDRFEIEIDELAVNLLTKAPLASDLRMVVVGMKVSHNLERIGDEATTISRRAVELNREPALLVSVDVSGMAKLALQMLKEALDSFTQMRPDIARSVVPQDKKVDAMNRQFQQELSRTMVQDPSRINACLNMMSICKSIERVGDHAANIAEEVVYLYEAMDIRHAGSLSADGHSSGGRDS